MGGNLEARECISVLEGQDHPKSVIEKACELSGMILEMGGIPNGAARARELLESGAALKKFREIVVAQGGRADLKSSDLKPGKYSQQIQAVKAGYINSLDNKALVAIAKAAGSPGDKGAGILLSKKQGQRRQERGEPKFEKTHPAPADGSIEIYVGNLSYDLTEEQLRKEFEAFGKVTYARIITNRYNGRSKGFGFVHMPNRAEVDAAVKALSDKEILGRKLKCNEAKNVG